MRKTLQFVRGAVSTKDLIPVLTNFHFYNGRVQGGNGRITIDAPLDLGGKEITVQAIPFIKAVDACDGQPELNITAGGKLTVKRGKFRSTLPLSKQEDFPLQVFDDGRETVCENIAPLIPVLRRIRPFIGEDASRPWACGAMFKDGYVYATNNVVMARIPWDVPDGVIFNLPSFAVNELIRIAEEPDSFFCNDNSATFCYDRGQRWMRSQLFSTGWPDVSNFFTLAGLTPVPEGLLDAVQKVRPFCPDPKFPVIHLDEKGVHTADGDMAASVGGAALPDSKYRAEPLELVLGEAIFIDLTKYPAPVPFAGLNGLQGVIVGVKA